MRIFKNSIIWWLGNIAISLFLVFMNIKWVQRGSIISLYQVYENAFSDLLILCLVIPNFFLIVIKNIDLHMSINKLLMINSRTVWWRKLLLDMIKICSIFSVTLLLPIGIVTLFFARNTRTITSLVYFCFQYISFAIILMVISSLIILIKLRWNQNILALFIVMMISFMPNIFSSIFRSYNIPTIGSIMTSSYSFQNTGDYYWLRHELVSVLLIVIEGLIFYWGEKRVKKQDFYFK